MNFSTLISLFVVIVSQTLLIDSKPLELDTLNNYEAENLNIHINESNTCILICSECFKDELEQSDKRVI